MDSVAAFQYRILPCISTRQIPKGTESQKLWRIANSVSDIRKAPAMSIGSNPAELESTRKSDALLSGTFAKMSSCTHGYNRIARTIQITAGGICRGKEPGRTSARSTSHHRGTDSRRADSSIEAES